MKLREKIAKRTGQIVSTLRRTACAFSFALLAIKNGLSASAAGLMTLDAQNDVVDKITKAETLFKSISKSFGVIIAIVGVIYFGKSFMSRQTEERAIGVAIFIGGVIIYCAGPIVDWLLA